MIGFDDDYVYTGGDLLLLYSHTAPQQLPDGSPLVIASADSFSNTFTPTGEPDFAAPTQNIFGSGFDANTRGFGEPGSGLGGGTVVQFSVTQAVPEPSSAALLLGIGMISAVRRRRK